MAEDLRALSQDELVGRYQAAKADLEGTSGEERQLLWDQILELQAEYKRRGLVASDHEERTFSIEQQARGIIRRARYEAAKAIIRYEEDRDAAVAEARSFVEAYEGEARRHQGEELGPHPT